MLYPSPVVQSIIPQPQAHESFSDCLYNLLVNYRSGDMWAPALDGTEALKVEVGHFLDCIEHGEKPITDGAAGLRVVKILEAAQMSIKAGGKRVAI